MSNNQLQAYRNVFRTMIRENDTNIIDNISSDHAVVIIQELIRSAEKRVSIICQKLSSYVYGNDETLRVIEDAIKRGVRFDVIIKERCPESEKCASLIGNVKTLRDRDLSKIDIPDFCVVDSRRFRFETDSKKRTAKVCANNEMLGRKMQEAFDSIARVLT